MISPTEVRSILNKFFVGKKYDVSQDFIEECVKTIITLDFYREGSIYLAKTAERQKVDVLDFNSAFPSDSAIPRNVLEYYNLNASNAACFLQDLIKRYPTLSTIPAIDLICAYNDAITLKATQYLRDDYDQKKAKRQTNYLSHANYAAAIASFAREFKLLDGFRETGVIEKYTTTFDSLAERYSQVSKELKNYLCRNNVIIAPDKFLLSCTQTMFEDTSNSIDPIEQAQQFVKFFGTYDIAFDIIMGNIDSPIIQTDLKERIKLAKSYAARFSDGDDLADSSNFTFIKRSQTFLDKLALPFTLYRLDVDEYEDNLVGENTLDYREMANDDFGVAFVLTNAFGEIYKNFYSDDLEDIPSIKSKISAFYENMRTIAIVDSAADVMAKFVLKKACEDYGLEDEEVDYDYLTGSYTSIKKFTLSNREQLEDDFKRKEELIFSFVNAIRSKAIVADYPLKQAALVRKNNAELERYVKSTFSQFLQGDEPYEDFLRLLNGAKYTLIRQVDEGFLQECGISAFSQPKYKTSTIATQQQEKPQTYSTYETDQKIRTKQDVKNVIAKHFDDLVGLGIIKQTLEGIINLRLKAPEVSSPLHIVLTGNAGVGKSTVAERISATLYDVGILKSKKLVKKTAAEMKAEYVGQTAPNVKRAFSEAEGGTLLLDEIYTLTEGKKMSDSFSNEAIGTLLNELERTRETTLVITAGYRDKTREFLASNDGLNRRFPYQLDIPDYSEEELMEIFDREIGKSKRFNLTREARASFEHYLGEVMRVPNFGNAGFVRDAVKKILNTQALMAELDDYSISKDIMNSYISEDRKTRVEAPILDTTRAKIGFSTSDEDEA